MTSSDSLEPRPERLDRSPKIRIDSRVDSVYSIAPTPGDGRNPRQYRNVRCPICQASLAVEEKDLGTTVVCPDCDTKIEIPRNLAYQETQYEKRYYNEESLQRDRLLSPLRNPERKGLDLDAANVYGVDSSAKNASDAGRENDADSVADAAARRSFQYRVVRCPLCGTELAATRADLGKTFVCPDCGTKVPVPKTLDFTRSESERRFDREKLNRDRRLSPIRNPNRAGIDVDSTNSYAIESGANSAAETSRRPTSAIYLTDAELAERAAEQNGAARKNDGAENVAPSAYIPVRCRVCETLTQVPRNLLGTKIRCPDCGTETVVSTAFQEQQAATDVRFAPRDRGVYALGEIPQAPRLSTPPSRSARPASPGVSPGASGGASFGVSPGATLNDAFAAAKEREKRRVDAERRQGDAEGRRDVRPSKSPQTPEIYSASAPVARTDESDDDKKRARQEKEAARLKRLLEIERQKEVQKARQTKRPRRYDETRDGAPLVLRRRGDQLVWALAPPPKRFPLFNGTFRPLFSSELRGRDVAVATLAGLIAAFCALLVFLSGLEARPLGGQESLGLLLATALAFPIAATAASLQADSFGCCFEASSGGLRQIVDCLDESPIGKFFYGVWLTTVLLAAAAVGWLLVGGVAAAVDAIFSTGADAAAIDALANEPDAEAELWRRPILFAAAVWLVFPVFFLSTRQSNAFFWPITGAILRSFFSQWIVWFQFYAASAAIFAVPAALSFRFGDRRIYWLFFPIAFVVLPELYGLLLGRLARVLEYAAPSDEQDESTRTALPADRSPKKLKKPRDRKDDSRQ